MRYLLLLLLAATCSSAVAAPNRLELRQDDRAGTMVVMLDGREIVEYQYGKQYAIPHFWPLYSPSGKELTSQYPDPYPHHRSIWIADKVQVVGGPAVDFYHCWKNYNVANDPKSGFRHFIRHQSFEDVTKKEDRLSVRAKLQWIVDGSTPIIDESRTFRIVPFDDGEYLMDLVWELRPVREEVKFISDWVHYAWPYVRMNPQFSGEKGGMLIDDRGNRGQEGTNEKTAKWIDYSNTIRGQAEGLALFVYPDGKDRKWLTREYGTFGPRRSEDKSGTQFTLEPGQVLHGRVGILVHRGDSSSGRVAERYHLYIEGKL